MLLKLLGDDGQFVVHANIRTCVFRNVGSLLFADIIFEPSGAEQSPSVTTFEIQKVAFLMNDLGDTLDKFPKQLGR